MLTTRSPPSLAVSPSCSRLLHTTTSRIPCVLLRFQPNADRLKQLTPSKEFLSCDLRDNHRSSNYHPPGHPPAPLRAVSFRHLSRLPTTDHHPHSIRSELFYMGPIIGSRRCRANSYLGAASWLAISASLRSHLSNNSCVTCTSQGKLQAKLEPETTWQNPGACTCTWTHAYSKQRRP